MIAQKTQLTTRFLTGLGFDDVRSKPLNVLSYSAGQESHSILLMLLNNKKIYDKYVGDGHLLVLMSDTGDEHVETYECAKRAKELCNLHNIDFALITKDMGFHTPAWQSLSSQYARTSTMGSVAFNNSCCTINLKINPIYKYLEKYVARHWGFETKRTGKNALVSLAQAYGKIHMMIGFNADEAARRIKPPKNEEVWMKKAVTRVYPLAELGITRQMSQDIIRGAGEKVPPPSHCKYCHFQSVVEIYHKYRFDRTTFNELVEIEEAKLKKFSHKGNKNLGFFGTTKTIVETIKIALEKPVKRTAINKPLKDWNKEELDDYRMSHGHCMSGGY
ncbi:MAG: phosphoadenosine phosphosulfate reductase family protein [Lentisphaeraceae bacterium]|nr:phosphoadenosine phosphosulfate reductase family protein [Lentisphaeraceae bacterium]